MRDHSGGLASQDDLEGFRAYLLAVASRCIEPALAAKVGASDLVQETLVVALRRAEVVRGRERREVRLWLKAILRHRVANARRHYFRTAKRRAGSELRLDDAPWLGPGLVDPETRPSVAALRSEQGERLERALATLPERHRRVLEGYREGLGFEDLARHLGISSDAARKLWGRAVLRLRSALGADDESR